MHTLSLVRNATWLVALACLVQPRISQAQTETLIAVFTTPDGGVTTNSYSGDVLVNVMGVGQAGGTAYNDAFYVYTDQAGSPVTPYFNTANSLQLAYSPNTLTTNDTNEAVFLSVIGGRPAYNSSHDYTFLLNTGLTSSGKLHFGVIDGFYSDNTGAYTITVSAVPEPGGIALLLTMTMTGAGFLACRRKNVRNVA